jgi:putative ABC transport system permease protein
MLSDLRYAARTLRRTPGFTAWAVLALALGIGANTAVFSVVYAVLLAPLPYPDANRVVQLSERNAAQGHDAGRVSRGTFVDWPARTRTIESLAAYSSGGESLWTIGDRMQVVHVAAATASLPRVLAVQPLLGRWFTEDETSAASTPQIVLSYGLWRGAFGSDGNIVGRTVLVEGRAPREIIGVMPPGFSFPEGAEAWVSVAVDGPVPPDKRRFVSVHAVGRMAGGITLDDVRAEFDALSAQIAAEQPQSNAGWTARVTPLRNADTAAVRPALLALLMAVAGVLLIACANVANMLLARAVSRRRDVAVRLALGASPARVARLHVIEAALLACGGTAAGILIGPWLCSALVRLAPPDVPRLDTVHVNAALLFFAAIAGCATATLVGMAPAAEAVRLGRAGGLAAGARAATPRTARVRRMLIASEIAVVVVLLTGALLFLRTFVQLRGVDLGFQPARVWNVSTRWPIGRFFSPGTKPWPRVQHAVDGLLAAVSAIPGVDAVGLISDVPLAGSPYSGLVWRDDAPGAAGLIPPADPRDRWRTDLSVVTPGYFTAPDIPIVRGRNFTDSDRLTDDQLAAAEPAASGVVIVNQAFVSRYFAGQDPVGRRLVLYDDQTFGWLRTIVGVVADVRAHAVGEPPVPAAYIPHAQHPDVFVPSLLVRSSLPSSALSASIRERVRLYAPQLLLQRIRPMDDVISGALSRPLFNLLLVGAAAVLGLALAAVGIYAVIAFTVVQRTREIGIRMALGARTADVLGLIVRDGMWPIAAGALVGLAASALGVRTLRSMLFGVAPLDPVSFVGAPTVLLTVALLACYVPARRAARIDPLIALREE